MSTALTSYRPSLLGSRDLDDVFTTFSVSYTHLTLPTKA